MSSAAMDANHAEIRETRDLLDAACKKMSALAERGYVITFTIQNNALTGFDVKRLTEFNWEN